MRVSPNMELFPLHFTLFFALARLRRAIFSIFLCFWPWRACGAPFFLVFLPWRACGAPNFPYISLVAKKALGELSWAHQARGPPQKQFFTAFSLGNGGVQGHLS